MVTKHIPSNNKYRLNLKRIVWETVLTSVGTAFSNAHMTDFWRSIGMNQTVCGIVQAIFTIVMLTLDYPMGYIADRFNRKVLNIIGDVGIAFTFILYAVSTNVYVVILAECLLGIFMAMTNGVDQSFIKYNAYNLDPNGELFEKINTKIYTSKSIALLVVTGVGAIISQYNLRFSVGLSFIPYILGAICAYKIEDIDVKSEVTNSNAFKDMFCNAKKILASKKTKIYLIAFILGKEITHSQVWLFTPFLQENGVSQSLIGLAWVLNGVMKILGSKIAEKMVNVKVFYKFTIPVGIELIWIVVLTIHMNAFTVWLFALNGFVNGMTGGLLITPLQKSTPNELQASVMSLASTGARLVYAPLVILINYIGNRSLKLALFTIFIIFFPVCIITAVKLKKFKEK